MGDKGGKKDKNKIQKQRISKHAQKLSQKHNKQFKSTVRPDLQAAPNPGSFNTSGPS